PGQLRRLQPNEQPAKLSEVQILRSPTSPRLQPASSSPSSSAEETLSDWQPYSFQSYGFGFRYPPNWRVFSKASEPTISPAPVHVDSIVSVRRTGSTAYPEYQSVSLVIAVYRKPTVTVPQWLSASYGQDVTTAAAGT